LPACRKLATSPAEAGISTPYFKLSPIFLAYKAGVVLYTFLKALKKDWCELKPDFSLNATVVCLLR
jgi:hypothetical protein